MTATRRAGNVSLLLLLLLCLLATATGCATEQRHRPSVVVTTNILGDLTRNVVGDEAEVTVLMQPGADPHSFGVSAPQAAAMEQADLVVHNGLGLEENVLRHVEAARASGVPTLAVGESVAPMTYSGGESAGRPTRTSGPIPYASARPYASSATASSGTWRASTPLPCGRTPSGTARSWPGCTPRCGTPSRPYPPTGGAW